MKIVKVSAVIVIGLILSNPSFAKQYQFMYKGSQACGMAEAPYITVKCDNTVVPVGFVYPKQRVLVDLDDYGCRNISMVMIGISERGRSKPVYGICPPTVYKAKTWVGGSEKFTITDTSYRSAPYACENK
ncbi:MAG: hypothetical protein HWD59_07905 [Coxiellaceae bacterium]|nr:MAG: hypothetical protein HWD59_07905 [Coxiellaceae bacterium]